MPVNDPLMLLGCTRQLAMCHHVFIQQNELHMHALVWFESELLVNFHNLLGVLQLSKRTTYPNTIWSTVFTFRVYKFSFCKLMTILIGYLDTWSGFETVKTAPWPSRRLHHFGKIFEPSDELAGRGCWFSWCGDIVGHFGLIRNEL